ncbi:MAG TPA: hypothetical protein VLW26_10110 [Steroidobacteraceae bacterium]|nr:hypothetical protein [Steroidobacteraceae bacterium]
MALARLPVPAGGALAALLIVMLGGSAHSADGAKAVTPPDLNGAWARYGAFGRPVDPKLAAPPAGKMMLKPAYAAPYEAHRAEERASDERGEPIAAAGVDCLPYGMPEMMSAIYPLEILQTPGQLTIIAEAMSQVRRIYLNKPQAKMGDVPPGYYGRSVGHWEGDTLVVDTIGVKESVLGHSEMPHSDQMRITERLRLVSPDVLHDQITVEDPVVLQQPWTFTFAYRRLPNYEMLEYVCENNHEYIDDKGVTHIRLQDAGK